jgi:hypothetical protein
MTERRDVTYSALIGRAACGSAGSLRDDYIWDLILKMQRQI